MAKKDDPKAKATKAEPEKKEKKAAKSADDKKKVDDKKKATNPAPATKEPKKEPAKPKKEVRIVEVDDDNDADNEVKNSVKAYHVSFRVDLNKWQVKLAKGEKALKTFSHQNDAIEFAKEMAKNQEGYIVIHKKTGKIRTQHYGKE